MMIQDIFTDIENFRLYVQGVDGSTEMGSLSPAYDAAESAVTEIIGSTVFATLAAMPDTDAVKRALKRALASYTMYRHLIFWSTSRNNTDQKLFKYQYEEIKEVHICQYWDAMNEILRYLDAHTATIPAWMDQPAYKDRVALPVKSADEFDYYYGIDHNEYFFTKVLFLIRTVTKGKILPRIGSFSDYSETDDAAFLEKVRRTLCYNVMAEAVMKFDLTELPRSMRYDLTHELRKDGSQMQSREKLYNNLMADVNAWLNDIENEVKYRRSSGNVTADFNEEKEKFFGVL